MWFILRPLFLCQINTGQEMSLSINQQLLLKTVSLKILLHRHYYTLRHHKLIRNDTFTKKKVLGGSYEPNIKQQT